MFRARAGLIACSLAIVASTASPVAASEPPAEPEPAADTNASAVTQTPGDTLTQSQGTSTEIEVARPTGVLAVSCNDDGALTYNGEPPGAPCHPDTRHHIDLESGDWTVFLDALDITSLSITSTGDVDVIGTADLHSAFTLTGTPHLVIEILSSDPARDINRKAAEYAAAGVERYWIIDPDGPTIIVCELSDDILIERGRHGPGTVVTLDMGPAEMTFDPARLLD